MRKKEPNKYKKYKVKIKYPEKVVYFDTVSLDFKPSELVSDITVIV